MRRSLRAVLSVFVLAAAFGSVAQAATDSASTGLSQSAGLSFSQYVPATGTPVSFVYGNLRVDSSYSLSANGTTPTVGLNPHASGYIQTCTLSGPPYWYCVSYTGINIPDQIVSQTALTMDPLGNTVTINLTVHDNAAPLPANHSFSVTMTRPQTSQPGYNYPNAWVDTNAQTAHVDESYLGISRYGYSVSGAANGITLVTSPPGCTQFCSYASGDSSTNVTGTSVTAGS